MTGHRCALGHWQWHCPGPLTMAARAGSEQGVAGSLEQSTEAESAHTCEGDSARSNGRVQRHFALNQRRGAARSSKQHHLALHSVNEGPRQGRAQLSWQWLDDRDVWVGTRKHIPRWGVGKLLRSRHDSVADSASNAAAQACQALPLQRAPTAAIVAMLLAGILPCYPATRASAVSQFSGDGAQRGESEIERDTEVEIELNRKRSGSEMHLEIIC
jgi:hypothetical protein